jgi:ABC-type nickel/cobalt efflux system permease component RcnA
LLWVLWVVPFVILIGIGFLGGRGWKTRAAGPFVILFFVSLVMFLGVMLTWGQWGEAEMQDAIDTSGHQGVEAVMLDKADDIAIDAAGSFVNDMQDIYMYMMIASGVGLAGVGVWWVVGSRGKKNVA